MDGQPAPTAPPGPPSPGSSNRPSIADRAYFGLRDQIVTLRLPPGTALIEDALMRELEIGRTPLREAVKRLALESLVEIRPRRGTYVTDVNVADIVHITEVRAELEGTG
jgi:DNA-binding GntR family transcriptional regulator